MRAVVVYQTGLSSCDILREAQGLNPNIEFLRLARYGIAVIPSMGISIGDIIEVVWD